MSAKMAQTEVDNEAENNQSGVEAAYEAVDEALQQLSITENRERWCELQKQYFDLKAAVLARDEEFQNIDLDGTRMNVPSSHAIVGDNPTAQDELGEVELPTRNDDFRVLDGIQVADPDNPHTTHAVTIDHVVEIGGEVRLEINAKSLDELPGGE